MTIFYKDPDAILDFAFDWSTWLDSGTSESIDDYTIEISPSGELTKDSDGETDGIVTVWLSAGDAGETYSLRCEIETSDGRTDERTMIIKVRER